MIASSSASQREAAFTWTAVIQHAHLTSPGISATTWCLPGFDCIHPLSQAGGLTAWLIPSLWGCDHWSCYNSVWCYCFHPCQWQMHRWSLWHWLSHCSGLGHNMHSQPESSLFPERSGRVSVSHRMPFCCFIAFRPPDAVIDALQFLSLSGL